MALESFRRVALLTSLVVAQFGVASEAQSQAGPAFACDGNIYQVQSGQLRIFDPVTSTYTNIGPQNGSYNATGFNVVDNYAYASQGGRIIRISANGVIETVLNIGFGSFSGDLDYSNNYYLRRNNSRYARINLATGAIDNVDFSGPGGGPADVAYVQSGGTEFLIGFSGSGGGTLYRYNLTTQSKENVALPGLPGGSFGAAWTDSTGRLFTFNNGNGRLYEVFDYLTGSPSFALVGNGDPSGNNDGFSCSQAPFPNLAPLAFDDEYTRPLNTTVVSNVLPDNGNGADNDPEGTALTVTTTPLSGPSNGTVTLASDGSFTYTPNTNFVGVDSFDYEITDASGLTATATVTITLTGTIDFTVAKTQVSGPDPVTAAGQVIGYNIVLTNIGDIPLTDISITDTLPDGTTANLGSPTEAGGTGSTAPGRLDVSETWSYSTTYTVTQDDVDAGAALVNAVSATSSETGATPRDASETTPIAATASFTIAKTALPTSLSAPGTIDYEVTVDNTGTVSLTNATFTDDLTQGAAGLNLTTGPTRTGDTDGDGELDPDETWVYTATFDVTQAQIDDGADLVNTATFNPDEAASQSSIATTTITRTPALTVAKTADTANLSAPGLITYEIEVANTGNVTLNAVTPTDTLTQGATSPALTSGPVLSSGDTNSNGALDVGETWVYGATFDATQDQIDNGADIVNDVTIATTEGAGGVSSATTTITSAPSFSIAKSVDTASLSAPGTLTYSIVVENTGNVSLTGISLLDEVAQGAATTTLTTSLSGDADSDSEVDPGETWVYAATFAAGQAQIDDGNDIVNTATFSTNELPDQAASATTTISQTSSIALSKAVATGEPTSFSAPGDTIDFTFTVSNTGNTTLAGPITVDDDQIGTGLVCSASDLAPGVTISCDFTWTASQADVDAGAVTNTATASGGAGITSPPQQATVTANQSPALSINKSIVPPVPATFSDGEVLFYEYEVINTGNVTLTQPITVDDNITTVSCPALPAGGLEPQAGNPANASNSITCTANYTITANDLALGSTTNVAFAETTFNGTPVVSPTDDAIFPVTATPVLELIKTGVALDTPLNSVGDRIEYSYQIRNAPPTSGTGAALSEQIFIDDDKLPAPFVCYDPATDGGPFAVGDTHICTALYTVTQADLDAGSVDNEAIAETIFAPASPSPVNVASRADTESLAIDATPGLTLAKSVTAGASPAGVGDSLTYSIIATNSGNQTLTNVNITDPLIPSLTCNVTAPVTLAPGASVTCTGAYVVTQDDIDGLTVGAAAPVLSNTATVAANNPSGGSIPTVDATNGHPLDAAAPAVSILKELFPDPTADPAYQDVGDNLQYRMTVTNTGNMTLSTIDVTDSLVPGTCSVGPLAPGETDQTCFFTYVVDQDDIDTGEVVNTATATAQPADAGAFPVVGTNDLTSPGPAAAGALTVLKGGTLDLGGDGEATPGDVITYAIEVRNTGNVTLTDISVADGNIDAGSLTYAGADDGDADDDIDSLAPGASATVTATHTLTQDDINEGSVSNSATATGQDPDGTDISDVSDSTNPGDGGGTDDPTRTQIPRGPAFTIVKTPSVATGVEVGQVITYSYLVTNTGNVTLTNITLDDQHTSASGTTALTISDDGIIPSLDPGDAVTLTGTYTVTQADVDANVALTNTVSGTATAPTGATDPTASDSASVDPIARAGAIEVIKTVDSITGSRAGDTITFEITVENTGNVSISDLTLTDTITRLDSTPITSDPEPVFASGDTGAQAGILDVGETWVYTVDYTLTQEDIDAGGVSNSVEATGQDPGGATVSDISGNGIGINSPTGAPIPPDPSVDLEKTASVPSRVSGNVFSVTFQIAFENTGNLTLNNVSLEDDLTTFLGGAGLVSATITDFIGPATVSTNAGYNGLGDPELLAPGGVLAVGDTFTLELEVVYDGSTVEPDGTNVVSFTSDERTTPATSSTTVVTTIADASISAVKTATPSNAVRGDLVTYTILFENNLNTVETGVTLVDQMPEGLVYQEGTALLNGAATPAPTRVGNLLQWGPLDIDPGEIVAVQLQARVLGGGGRYINEAYALNPSGARVSNTATATIEVRAEAVFDCSDVIGKVFDDVDGNGAQARTERGERPLREPGISGVKVVTTRGTIITTDEHGRFSVPCAELPDRLGSNFTLKLDTRSLPTGYRVTTENPRVMRLTPGKMARMNFGARLGNIVDVDLMADAFAVENGKVVLKPALETALIHMLRHIKDEPTALRLSYLRTRETTERAVDHLDLVEAFIEDEWREIGEYRLSIERIVAVTR